MPAAERTMSATEFKAKCLDIMDQLAARKLDRVTVTKRGRPVAVMAPPPLEAASGERHPIFGWMKGYPSPVPLDHDWEKPLYSDEELDGFTRDLQMQMHELMPDKWPKPE